MSQFAPAEPKFADYSWTGEIAADVEVKIEDAGLTLSGSAEVLFNFTEGALSMESFQVCLAGVVQAVSDSSFDERKKAPAAGFNQTLIVQKR